MTERLLPVINTKPWVSPNHSSRGPLKIKYLIIHSTGGAYPGCAEWLCSPASAVSAHFLLLKNATVYQLVDPINAAWHCGISAWDENSDGKISKEERQLNRSSLGIELENYGRSGYEDGQLEVLYRLSAFLIEQSQYRIPIWNVLGHKEIAPGRKRDPVDFNMNTFRARLYERIKKERERTETCWCGDPRDDFRAG